MLSTYLPFPSMLILTPLRSRSPENPSPMNWLPWSVLKTSGVSVTNASSKASTQKSASRVLESRQVTTYRLYQSMMATSYRNPMAMGT